MQQLRRPHGPRLILLLGFFSAWLVGAGGSVAGASSIAQVSLPPMQSGALATCPEDFSSVQAGESLVQVVKVSGLIDRVVKDSIVTQVENPPEGAFAVLLWVDSHGSVLSDDDYADLAQALQSYDGTLAFWVGQPGAIAAGGAAELAGLADVVGVSPGSTIGDIGEPRLSSTMTSPVFVDSLARLQEARIGADEAIQLGVSVGPTEDTATIGTFLTHIPGYEVFRCLMPEVASDEGVAGGDSEADAAVSGANPRLRTVPVTRVQIAGLSVLKGFMHTVASPEVAYLFFVLGLGLLIFELYTAGVGIAGVLGAAFVALGSYGIAELPTRWWAVGLLVAAFVAMAVDVQTNLPRLYTVVGMVLFTLGTFLLYDGVSMSWLTAIVGIIGALLYAYSGMPSMVRTRFSTPTIGRKWMIGEMVTAVTDIDPEGTIVYNDAKWRAITNRATPVLAGDSARVIGIDRLLLEVEPEEGGARDYRERATDSA